MSDFITIPLSKKGKHAGKYTAIVSPEDADLAVFNWKVSIRDEKRQYALRDVWVSNGVKVTTYLHRVIMERMLERNLEKGEMVDHTDMNGLNCFRGNLRLATMSQNQANRPAQKNNKSGRKGVTWSKDNSKWQARIKFHGKTIHLGYFDDIEAAYDTYCNAAKQYQGKFARGE